MPKNTKIDDIRTPSVATWAWISLFVLAAGAYFAGLDMPLVGPDEPRYAQVAREMFIRGDLITPTLGGYHWFEKPALLYWLQIGAYSLLGVTEFAARLGPALFGFGTILSLWMLGRSVDVNSRDDVKNGSFAIWLALIATSSLGIIVFAHGASFDIIVTFPMAASLVSFFIFDQAKPRNFRSSTLPLLLFYFFIGLALLAKGLIGIVFPFAIVGLYHLLSRKLPNKAFTVSLVWGTMLAVAVAATWYWPMYHRHGYEFVDEFFLQHHFQRFTSNKYQHPQPFYFFFWVLPLMTIPWLPFFGAAVVSYIRGLFREPLAGSSTNSSPLLLFAWAWLLVPLVFFSLSGSKLPGYILPAVPAAIVVTGTYVYGLVKNSFRWRNIVLGLAGLTFAVLIAVALFAAPRFAERESVKSLLNAADARGHVSEPVLMFLRIAHNAEFYAAGRLVRDNEGKQRRISTKEELVSELQILGGRAVVLVPTAYFDQLSNTEEIETEVLGNNDEFSIAIVFLKN
ncbi:hypothetical protein BH20ACI2_BH20ACI2_01440 [soil metagenome]